MTQLSESPDMRRASALSGFLDSLTRPTPAMLWLESAARQLRNESKEVRQADALAMLLKRDGDECWFCGKQTAVAERSIEHLQPLSKGGTWDVENLALAHRSCNQRAGDLHLVNKLKLREQARRAREEDRRAGILWSDEK